MDRKVQAASLGAALVTIVAAVTRDFLGYELSADVQGALTTLAVAGLGYFVPNAKPKPAA